MDPVKVQGVQDWPIPCNLKDTCGFLGFCNFYHHFIRGFSELAHPLNDLTKKDMPWDWTPERQQAFDTLKECVSQEPILMAPDLARPFELEVDALSFAIGAVLSQRGDDSQLHPVAFYSATFTPME
jgi:hypothetical protein